MLPIYIINLPQRIDRLKRIMQQLDGFGLEYNIFPATYNEDGAYGLRKTMIELFTQTKENEILVLEDDCCFLQDPIEVIIQAYKELPQNYDLLFLGGNVYKPANKYSHSLYQLNGCVGNHAVVYTRKVMDEMAHHYAISNEPTDMILDKRVVQKGGSYIANPLLAIQYEGYSDIQKVDVNYNNYLVERYHKNVN